MFAIANISRPEIAVAIAGTALLATAGIVALVRWFTGGPEAPDPWGEDICAKIAPDETPALCHRCLLPNPPETDFCSHCGATVGTYTRLLPLLHIYPLVTGCAWEPPALSVILPSPSRDSGRLAWPNTTFLPPFIGIVSPEV